MKIEFTVMWWYWPLGTAILGTLVAHISAAINERSGYSIDLVSPFILLGSWLFAIALVLGHYV